ncbi:hypothetical protein BKA56DRAFT_593759 [Ilyonectria sp. MPI-CAGE-AT-0026]|nr:hypothetical protein BKA56DRAFT_593759 [Ilyonectria sp. MPI-CAGE-AT-0026]
MPRLSTPLDVGEGRVQQTFINTSFTTHSKRKSGQHLSPNLSSGSHKSARNEVGLSGVYQI